MAWMGSGTQLGGGLYAAGQVVWTVETVIQAEGALTLPPFRLTGAPNLSVMLVNDFAPDVAPPTLDVLVRLYAPAGTGGVTGDLISTGQYLPIRDTQAAVVPPGEAFTLRWDRYAHPTVMVQILDNRPVQATPFPIRVSVGATG